MSLRIPQAVGTIFQCLSMFFVNFFFLIPNLVIEYFIHFFYHVILIPHVLQLVNFYFCFQEIQIKVNTKPFGILH